MNKSNIKQQCFIVLLQKSKLRKYQNTNKRTTHAASVENKKSKSYKYVPAVGFRC